MSAVVRRLLPATLLLAALLGAAAPPTAPAAAIAAVDARAPNGVVYRAPVVGRVVRAFEPPGTAYGPGHRGVDLAVAAGEVVTAVARGVVAHAGPVAGTTWVSIDHPDGVRTAYGPLAAPAVAHGQAVAAGTVIGRLADGGHGRDRADRGLHFSARRDGRYLDPLALFGARRRPSLAPAGGPSAPGRRAEAPRAAVAGPPRVSTDAGAAGARAPTGAPGAPGGRWTP